jgi:hypothetical protein
MAVKVVDGGRIWGSPVSFAAMAVKVVDGGRIWGSPVSFAAMAVKVVDGRGSHRRQGPIVGV